MLTITIMFLMEISINLASGNVLLSNGIALQNHGQMYIYRSDFEYTVVVKRPTPSQKLKEIEFTGCHCYKEIGDQRWTNNSTECNGKAQNTFLKIFEERYNKTMSEIEESANLMGYRKKRGGDPFSMILGAVNFGWNGYQEIEITNLKKVSLRNANSIKTIATALLDTNKRIQVTNSAIYADLNRLGKELCKAEERDWREEMTTRAEMVAIHYLSEVEDEALSFIEGRFPARTEYVNLFRGICEDSCADIDSQNCTKYCKMLLQDLPTQLKPILKGINRDEDGVKIVFQITLPRLVMEPMVAFKTTRFGIIEQIQSTLFKKIPIVRRYAADVGRNVSMELSDSECYKGRDLLVCPSNAVMTESCLCRAELCNYDLIPTLDKCTYAYVAGGLAIYSLETAYIQQLKPIKEMRKRTEWTGMKFVPAMREEHVVDCSKLQHIIVPVKTVQKTIAMVIRPVKIKLSNFTG